MTNRKKVRRPSMTILAVLAALHAGPAATPASAAEPGDRLARLAWLAGCWRRESAGRVIHEQWMAPLGGTMLGMGRTVAAGRTIEYEAMRIQERDGKVVFTAHPSGQDSASFAAIELTDSSVVFENPAHDFPQRVIYRRRADGSLLGRIEGAVEGKARAVDFPMRRVSCDGAAAGVAPAASEAAQDPPAARADGRGFAAVNGTRLFYELRGTGDRLVLIHGGQLDSRMWDEQFDLFAREFRVLRYDVRGYGGSGDIGAPYSDAEDLAAILDYAGMAAPAHVVGLSLGGRIAIDFALTHPERVASLVLAGPGLAGFDAGDSEEDARWWAMVQAARDEGPQKAIEMWLACPYMAPAMEHADLAPRLSLISRENDRDWIANPVAQRSPRPAAAARLAEIRAPTLLILGDRDVPTIKAIVDTLSKSIAGAEKVVIAGAGHMVSMERPDAFNRAALEFLRRVRARGAANGVLSTTGKRE